jgi:hypothetical protein
MAMRSRAAPRPGLPPSAGPPIVPAMASWSAKRVIALLLAVLVTAGMGLPAAGGDMAPAMAIDADRSATHDCDACAGDADSDAMSCPLSVCTAPALAATLPVVSTVTAGTSRLLPATGTSPSGRSSLPDPYPPRTTALV